MCGHISLTQWQVDYIGPLLMSEGAIFALITVDTATTVLPSGQVKQHTKIHTLTVLTTLYSQLITIESD